MKFFDRLIAINTAIVGFAIIVALIFPSAHLPKLPDAPIHTITVDRNEPTVSVPHFQAPSINFKTPQLPKLTFKNPFAESEPHIAGVFAEESVENTRPIASPTSTPAPTATPIPIADPVSIEIPSIAVSAQIVRVGLTEENAMEIPHDFASVGWYYPSGKPGEDVSAILNGHYDDASGRPAAFYNLKKLTGGDQIIITAADGKNYIFNVDDVFSHPLEAFPHDLLYEDLDGQQLKLLTCDGVWNVLNKNYSNRLVVAAHLVEVR